MRSREQKLHSVPIVAAVQVDLPDEPGKAAVQLGARGLASGVGRRGVALVVVDPAGALWRRRGLGGYAMGGEHGFGRGVYVGEPVHFLERQMTQPAADRRAERVDGVAN